MSDDADGDEVRQAVMEAARSLTGVPYRWSGEMPFDTTIANATLPLDTVGREVPIEDLQPGDVIFPAGDVEVTERNTP